MITLTWWWIPVAPGLPEGPGAEDYTLFQGSAAETAGKDPLEIWCWEKQLMTLVFYLVTKQTQWDYTAIKFGGSTFGNTHTQTHKSTLKMWAKQNKGEKRLGDSINNLSPLPQQHRELKRKRQNANMVHPIQPQLGEEQKSIVFSIANWNKWANHRKQTKEGD